MKFLTHNKKIWRHLLAPFCVWVQKKILLFIVSFNLNYIPLNSLSSLYIIQTNFTFWSHNFPLDIHVFMNIDFFLYIFFTQVPSKGITSLHETIWYLWNLHDIRDKNKLFSWLWWISKSDLHIEKFFSLHFRDKIHIQVTPDFEIFTYFLWWMKKIKF